MNDNEPKSTALTIIGGIIAMLAMLFSYLLVEHGKPTAAILSIAGPILGSIFVVGYVKDLTTKQNQKLETQAQNIEQVREQTNGKLDAKFRELHEKIDALPIPNSGHDVDTLDKVE